MTQLPITKEQAQIEALKKESADLASACMKLNITDDTTLGIAQQKLSEALKLQKKIDAIRVEVKEPYFEACKQIDALAKKLMEPLKMAIDDGKSKMLHYDRKKKEEALKEQNRILAIKADIAKYSNIAISKMDACKTIEELRIVREELIVKHPGEERWFEFLPDFMQMRLTLNEYAKSRKTAILTPQQADEQEAIIIKEVIQEDSNKIGTEAIAETVVTKMAGTRKTWKFTTDNIDNCPKEWLQINEKVVKEWLSENKDNLTDGVIINGVCFYLEDSITIR